MVSPPISPSQAEKSVELLKKLGLIEKCSHGSYQVSSKAITSGDLPSFTLAVANFQQETMKLAWEAHDRYPKDKRNISSVTLGISERGVEEITKEIEDFRNKIINIANEDEPADRVYQLNFQFFPMSSSPSIDNHKRQIRDKQGDMQ
jgi:uncharacterized protein (TIGR02147 family)